MAHRNLYIITEGVSYAISTGGNLAVFMKSTNPRALSPTLGICPWENSCIYPEQYMD